MLTVRTRDLTLTSTDNKGASLQEFEIIYGFLGNFGSSRDRMLVRSRQRPSLKIQFRNLPGVVNEKFWNNFSQDE